MKRCMFIKDLAMGEDSYEMYREREKWGERITSQVIFFLPCTFYQRLLAPTSAKKKWCDFEVVFEIRRKGTCVSPCDLRHRKVLPPIDCLSLVQKSPRLSQQIQGFPLKVRLFLMRNDYQLTFLPKLLLSVSRMNQNWGGRHILFHSCNITQHLTYFHFIDNKETKGGRQLV